MKTQPKAPKWVKCSERMPGEIGHYMVSVQSGRGRPAYWSGRHWRKPGEPHEILGCVTHWLDCPDPEPDDGFEDYWLKQYQRIIRDRDYWKERAQRAEAFLRTVGKWRE